MRQNIRSRDTDASPDERSAMSGMFLSLNTQLIRHPDLLEAAIADIAAQGFQVVYLQFRDSVYEPLDPEAIDAAHRAAKYARAAGLRVWIMLVPDNKLGPGAHYAKRWPEGLQEVINSYEAKLVGGRSECRLTSAQHAGRDFLRVERVFRPTQGGVQDVTQAVRVEFSAHNHFPGDDRARGAQGYGVLSIEAPGVPDGPLWVYTRHSVELSGFPTVIDYSKPYWRELGSELLDRYADLDVDGIGWDEFMASCTFHERAFGAISEPYLNRFRARHGYDLRGHLWALDHDVVGTRSSLVRFHHWSTLAELHRDVLTEWRQRTREAWRKPRLEAGIHQTLGEASSFDLHIGSLDLFNTVTAQTGGFTDSKFSREDVMLFCIALARGLGDASEQGTAWNNSWDYAPTDAHLDYYTRVMAMHRTSWLGHLYGSTGIFGPGYPYHATWKSMSRHTRRLKVCSELLQGYEPHAEIALLYTWAGTAALPDYRYMDVHRTSDAQAVARLLHSGHGVNIVGVPQLERATIDGSHIVIGGRRYATLLAPWLEFLSNAAWDRLIAFSRAGGRLVMWGPPATTTAEGTDAAARLAQLLGGSLVRNEYAELAYDQAILHPLRADRQLPASRPASGSELIGISASQLPALRLHPIEPAADAQPLFNTGGTVIGVRHGNSVYVGIELPLLGRSMLQVLDALGQRPLLELPSDAIGRVLVGPVGTRPRVAIASCSGAELASAASCSGHHVELSGSSFVVSELSPDGSQRLYAEDAPGERGVVGSP